MNYSTQFNPKPLTILLFKFDLRLMYVKKINTWVLAPQKFKYIKGQGLEYIGFNIDNVVCLDVIDKDNKEAAENKALLWIKNLIDKNNSKDKND